MKRPFSRTVRRCAALGVVVYICAFSFRGSGNTLGDRHSQQNLKETVDKVLDDRVSDFLLSGNPFQQNRDDLRKILSVQSTLSCLVREGMWKPGLRTERPWPSFTPKEECSIRSKLGSSASTRNSSLNICQLLSGKKILFVGPETTFYLHSLWLDSLETRERRSYTCLGQEFCTFHHICRPPAAEIDDSGEISGRKKKMPSKNLLLTTRSSLLQYTHSTTLYASQNKHDEGYTAAVVDEQSNVRVPNAYWLRRARKAGIVVMNRGPLPAPGSTYNFANGLVGNWTFTKTLCADNNYLDPLGCDATLGSRLVNAALSATTDRFLPSLLLSLQAISKDFEIARSLLVWQGSWYIQPLCAKAGLPGTIPLLRDIWSDSEGALIDPWSIYYNSQVYMHDRLLPQILPYFNITYLPLTMPAYVKPSHPRFPQYREGFSWRGAKDCIREPWPGFGTDVLEETFFNALATVLSRH